jgi:RNA polymerase sigma-70 factor (ECF subfamily)
MTLDLERAKAGDERAFATLAEPFRRELQLHCYRLLGSVQDAEDLVQETLLAAWRGLDGFEERASLRSWLYRIATNRSLNAIRERGRRPATENTMNPSRVHRAPEPSWLEPYPDTALPDPAPGPEARYEQREAIQLSFIVALQNLPAKQRAALVLRDVLGFHTDEAASILETTPQSRPRSNAHAQRSTRTPLNASRRRYPTRRPNGTFSPPSATPSKPATQRAS